MTGAGSPDERSTDQRPADTGPADPGRRHFFRAFSREAIHTAATVAGAANAFRRGTTAAGAELLGLGLGTPGAVARLGETAGGVPGEVSIGFHSPYRLEGDVLVLLDQRRLPDAASDIRCQDGYEVAMSLRDFAAEGAPLLAQLAAYAMALTARRWQDSSAEEREGRLRVAAAALRNARPGPAALHTAVERAEARCESLRDAPGPVLADALRADADALADQATLDHARIGRLGAERLRRPGGPALALLTVGSVGALAGGAVGTALAVIQAIVAEGDAVDVWVAETRPSLAGARLTAWELSQAGIQYTVVPDSAAAWLLSTGRVDAVLVGAERIAANGDVLNTVGTYPIAVVAERHAVPVYVCAPTLAIDPLSPDGVTLPEEMRPGGEVTALGDRAVTPTGAHVLSPAYDVTPADLIRALITEQGIVEPPYGEKLSRMVAAGPGQPASETAASDGAQSRATEASGVA